MPTGVLLSERTLLHAIEQADVPHQLAEPLLRPSMEGDVRTSFVLGSSFGLPSQQRPLSRSLLPLINRIPNLRASLLTQELDVLSWYPIFISSVNPNSIGFVILKVTSSHLWCRCDLLFVAMCFMCVKLSIHVPRRNHRISELDIAFVIVYCVLRRHATNSFSIATDPPVLSQVMVACTIPSQHFANTCYCRV